jgi:inhibitor of cysteine peptidase
VTTIRLTAADNGRNLAATPDDEIIVVLAENPTTGYRWHADVQGDAVALESDGYQPPPQPEPPEPVFGRGAQREFRFRVVAAGNAVLELKLWREWEGDPSVVERVTLTVVSL